MEGELCGDVVGGLSLGRIRVESGGSGGGGYASPKKSVGPFFWSHKSQPKTTVYGKQILMLILQNLGKIKATPPQYQDYCMYAFMENCILILLGGCEHLDRQN